MARFRGFLFIFVALLIAPAPATAATTCDLSSGVLDVSMTANGDGVQVVPNGSQILVRTRTGTVITCTGAAATTSNTNSISVHNSPGLTNNDVFIFDPSDFVPGSVAEPGTDEIEIFVNLNGVTQSELQVNVHGDGGSLEFGTSGVNFNPGPTEDLPDADVIHNDTSESLSSHGSTESDVVKAQGGPGSGAPLNRPIRIFGRGGDDVLWGGNASDDLRGDEGEDQVQGFGGSDFVAGGFDNATNTLLSGGDGDDIVEATGGLDGVDGGPGADDLTFVNVAGVSARLEGTNIETVFGTSFDDVLRGGSGPETINGEEGNDEIDGGGGADQIDAGADNDSVLVRDGVADTATCGPGTDSATADALGVDLITDCETVLFPAPPDPGGGGGTAGGGTTAGSGTTAGVGGGVQTPAFGARTLVTLALAAGRIPARGPVPVRVTNTNGFDVIGRLSGPGLRAKSFAVGPNARRTVRLVLSRRVRRALARRGKVKVLVTAAVRDPSGNARTVRKTITLRLRKRTR